jgi:hypothetical protein
VTERNHPLYLLYIQHSFSTLLLEGPKVIERNHVMRWAMQVSGMTVKRNEYRIFVGKPEGKRPLGRPSGWIILKCKMGVREMG